HLRRAAVQGADLFATVVAEIVLAFLLVYFHPMTTVYLISLLLACEGAARLYPDDGRWTIDYGAARLHRLSSIVHRPSSPTLPPLSQFVFIAIFLAAIVVTVGVFMISSSERYPIRVLRILIILSVAALAWWGSGRWTMDDGRLQPIVHRPSSIVHRLSSIVRL